MTNRNHLIRGFVMNESANDLEFPDGVITPSEYERERFDLGYSFRRGEHTFTLDIARNNTGDAGTPALPMDILSIDSNLFRTRYRHTGTDGTLTAELFGSNNEHWMTNFHSGGPAGNIFFGPNALPADLCHQ